MPRHWAFDIERAREIIRDSPGPDAAVQRVLSDSKVRLRAVVEAWVTFEFGRIEREKVHEREREAQAARQAARDEEQSTPEWKAAERKRREEFDERMEEIDRRASAGIKRTLDVFLESMKMEWTQELLACSFALGDGRQVLWGEATVAEHQQRVEMLSKQAKGTLETAARHEAAIRDLKAHQAATLNDLVAVTR